MEKTYNFKEIMSKEERFAPGHRMCAGCGGTVTVRAVLRALLPEDKTVIGNATGCLEVSSFMYPYTAYEDTLSGVETAYRVLKKKGKIDDTFKFITFGGDGGTYDIGFQSLSGAMERGHDMVYVCYDNGAYMNTGTQRSSATPQYADTTTTPAGKVSNGKVQVRKDLTAIMAEHHIPYAAQTTLTGNFKDIHTKAERAIYTPGAAFLNVMSPCPSPERGSSVMCRRRSCPSRTSCAPRSGLSSCLSRKMRNCWLSSRLRWTSSGMLCGFVAKHSIVVILLWTNSEKTVNMK